MPRLDASLPRNLASDCNGVLPLRKAPDRFSKPLYGGLSTPFRKYNNVFPGHRSLPVAARNEAAHRAATARERYAECSQNTSVNF